jgi:glycosyltransferase involved in cell wall biosynthesis
MRIGIYVDVAKEEELRGVGLHVVNLVEQLGRLDRENDYLLYYHRGLLQPKTIFRHCPPQSNFRLRPVRFPIRWLNRHPRLWWKYYLPLVAAADRVDIFHGPNHFLPALPSRKTVVTIHDVAAFKLDLYGAEFTQAFRHWTMQALEAAGRVIAISQNTRADVEALGVDPNKIRVIYGGGHIVPEGEIAYHRRDELRRQFNLPESYILFVGTLAQRKNVPFLLRSYAQLKKTRQIPHGLVLAGKKFLAFDQIEQLIRELEIERDVIITGYVDAWQIPLLYKMADLFVLPTLYEGFGLILLEAMAYGVPVISTDTSCIREVVGEAGLIVPVDDVPALAQAMLRVLTDAGLRQSLVQRGTVQAQQFTWERCARETLALYQELYDIAPPDQARDQRRHPGPKVPSSTLHA